MLRVFEIVASLRLARAVGRRHYGMFDHTASAVIGPNPIDEQDDQDNDTDDGIGVRYEQYFDEETGEPLFRPTVD